MRFFLFVLTLFAGPVFAGTSTVGCDDLSGVFSSTDSYGNTSALTCPNGSGKTATCTMALFKLITPPHTGQWCNLSYNATFQTTGTDAGYWDYAGSYTSGSCGSLPSSWNSKIQFTDTTATCTIIKDFELVQSGYAYNFWRYQGTDGVNDYPNISIEIPGTNTSGTYNSGELTSQFYGSITSGGLVAAGWTAVLTDHNDSTFQFSGRNTTEYIPDLTACGKSRHSTNSLGDPGNSYWDPDVANNYSVGWGYINNAYTNSPDYTGDTVADIIWVQRNYSIALPCDANYNQTMYISSSGTPAYTQYQQNSPSAGLALIHEYGDGTMRFKRGGSSWSTTYNVGQKRTVWRWNDWEWWWLLIPTFFQ